MGERKDERNRKGWREGERNMKKLLTKLVEKRAHTDTTRNSTSTEQVKKRKSTEYRWNLRRNDEIRRKSTTWKNNYVDKDGMEKRDDTSRMTNRKNGADTQEGRQERLWKLQRYNPVAGYLQSTYYTVTFKAKNVYWENNRELSIWI